MTSYETLITDRRGKAVGVLLDLRSYRRMLAQIEELASIRAYDAAKASKGRAILFEQAIAEIERT